MKKRDYFLHVGILFLACLVLLGAVLLSGCSSNEKTPDKGAEAKDLDEFYEEYGIRLAERYMGKPDVYSSTFYVVDVDTTREVITIPETLNGKPITAIEIDWNVEGEHALDEGYVTRDCGKLKKLVISKNITSIACTNGDESEPVGWSLEYFEVAEDNPAYCSVDGIIYNKEKTEIVWVPKGIKGTVTLPDTVTKLTNGSLRGGTAFSGCKELEGLIIPDSVTSMDIKTLKYCPSLKKLTIPFVPTGESLGHFASGAPLEEVSVSGGEFSGLNGHETVKRLILGDNVTLTDNCVFRNNGNLEEIRLPSDITEISNGMFESCTALKEVVIPKTVTVIGDYAFENCESLESVDIPRGVTVIGNRAFVNCYSLANIRFNAENIEEKGYDVFKSAGSDTDGVTLVIGKDVKQIPDRIFEEFGKTDGQESGTLVRVDFEDESACTSIGRYAFYYNKNLLSVTLGESVTEVGEDAFQGCERVAEIINRSAMELTYDNSGSLYDARYPIEGVAFHNGDSLLTKFEDYWVLLLDTPIIVDYVGTATELTLPTAINNKAYDIGAYAFTECNTLKSVVIPDCVKEIGGGAFYICEALETVTIGKGVKCIGSNAFVNSNNIKTVYYNAVDCADLTRVDTYNGHVYGYEIFNNLRSGDAKLIVGAEVKRIPAYLLNGCVQFSEVIFAENSVCEELGLYAFDGTGFMRTVESSSGVTYVGNILLRAGQSCSGEVVVREGTLGIARSAFANCENITSIVLPSSVKSIGDRAFERCYALISVNIPDGVRKIGDYTFGYCNALTSVELPDSVTEIGECAFLHCNMLQCINIPAGVTEIHTQTFAYCYELVEIKGGEGLAKVAKDATLESTKIALTEFGNIKYRFFTPVEPVDENITYAIFKRGTTVIPERFFEDCTSLLGVYIPADVETIGDYAFYNVNILIRVFDERAEREGGAWKIVFMNGNMKYYLDMTYSDIRYGYLFNGAVLDTSGLVYLPSDGKIVGYIGNAAELTIPARLSDTQITSIAPYAFCSNATLTKLTVEKGIENIGECAFAGCTSLNTVILNGGTVLDIGTFYSCTALEKVDASMGTLTHIRPYAFGACTNLSDVKLSPTLLIINANAFDGCTAIEELTIPASVQIMEANAFNGLVALTSVSFEKQEWYVANVAGDTRLEVNCADPTEAAEMLCDTYVAWYWFEKGYGDTNTEA